MEHGCSFSRKEGCKSKVGRGNLTYSIRNYQITLTGNLHISCCGRLVTNLIHSVSIHMTQVWMIPWTCIYIDFFTIFKRVFKIHFFIKLFWTLKKPNGIGEKIFMLLFKTVCLIGLISVQSVQTLLFKVILKACQLNLIIQFITVFW